MKAIWIILIFIILVSCGAPGITTPDLLKKNATPTPSGSSLKFVSKIGLQGAGFGQLQNPIGITKDLSEKIAVVDSTNNRIQLFNKEGDCFSQVGSFGSGAGLFDAPKYAAINPINGYLYVTDQRNFRVQIFNTNYDSHWGTEGSGLNQFREISGIAIDGFGQVYVIDSHPSAAMVKRFTSDGTFIDSHGSYGINQENFLKPIDVKVNSQNHFWVLDIEGRKLVKHNNAGARIIHLGGGQHDLYRMERFINPTAMALDSEDNIYIIDTGDQKIKKFRDDGSNYTVLESYDYDCGTGENQIYKPTSMLIDGNMIYITDNVLNCVKKFEIK
jgi:DNA-binding beta-propeller fold protein YncE